MNHLIMIICQLEIIFSTYLGYYRSTRDASSQVQDNTGKICLTTIFAVCVLTKSTTFGLVLVSVSIFINTTDVYFYMNLAQR